MSYATVAQDPLIIQTETGKEFEVTSESKNLILRVKKLYCISSSQYEKSQHFASSTYWFCVLGKNVPICDVWPENAF